MGLMKWIVPECYAEAIDINKSKGECIDINKSKLRAEDFGNNRIPHYQTAHREGRHITQ